MALINCEECGNMISDKASVCPHCGCPTNGNDVSLQDNDTTDIVVSYKDKENNSHKWLYIIIGLLTIISVGMVVWAWNSGGFSSSQENATSQGDDFILGNTFIFWMPMKTSKRIRKMATIILSARCTLRLRRRDPSMNSMNRC